MGIRRRGVAVLESISSLPTSHVSYKGLSTIYYFSIDIFELTFKMPYISIITTVPIPPLYHQNFPPKPNPALPTPRFTTQLQNPSTCSHSNPPRFPLPPRGLIRVFPLSSWRMGGIRPDGHGGIGEPSSLAGWLVGLGDVEGVYMHGRIPTPGNRSADDVMMLFLCGHCQGVCLINLQAGHFFWLRLVGWPEETPAGCLFVSKTKTNFSARPAGW